MPICTMRLRVEQALLDRAAEGRAVGVGIVAEIAVVGVGMGVEMDHAERPAALPSARRIGSEIRWSPPAAIGMAPAARMPAKKAVDLLQRVHQVDRVDRRSRRRSPTRDQIVGRDAGDMMDAAHQARLVADLARAVARAGAVGGAAVERHADQRDVDLGRRESPPAGA